MSDVRHQHFAAQMTPLVTVAVLAVSVALAGCTPSAQGDGESEMSYEHFENSEAMKDAATLVVRASTPSIATDSSLSVPRREIVVHSDGRTAAEPVLAPIYELNVAAVISGEATGVNVGDRIRVAASVDTNTVPVASQEALLTRTGAVTAYLMPSGTEGVWVTLTPYQGIEPQ